MSNVNSCVEAVVKLPRSWVVNKEEVLKNSQSHLEVYDGIPAKGHGASVAWVCLQDLVFGDGQISVEVDYCEKPVPDGEREYYVWGRGTVVGGDFILTKVIALYSVRVGDVKKAPTLKDLGVSVQVMF